MTFVINRNAWHYRLHFTVFPANSWPERWERQHNNFCTYWRATVFRLLLLTMSLTVILSLVGFLGWSVWAYPMEWVSIVAFVLGFVVSVAVLFGVILGMVWLWEWATTPSEAAPGLIKQQYLAWKGRYCPTVEYKNG